MKYIITFFLLLLTPTLLYAQTDSPTATNAPTKTPEPTQETSLGIVPTPGNVILQPFTQDDLNVLVGNVQRPNGITWFNDQLYTACNGDWTLYEIDSNTGATVTFVFGVRDAHQMIALDTDTGFDLWIPDFSTDSLVLVDETRTTPVTITTDNLNGPWGIIDVEEDFLITNTKANSVVMVNREGESQILSDELRSPTGIIKNDEQIFIANNGSARRAIEWIDQSIVADVMSQDEIELNTLEFNPLVSGLQNTSNLFMADDGFLYFTYALGSRGVVGRVNPGECLESGCSGDEVEIVLYTDLPSPLAGLAVTPDFRLFVHSIYRPEIYWLNLYQ